MVTQSLFLPLAAMFPVVSPILMDAAIKGAALLAVAGLLTLALGRASAAQRHLVWMLALGGTLALPVLSALLPAWQVLPRWPTTSATQLNESLAREKMPAPQAITRGPLADAKSVAEMQRQMMLQSGRGNTDGQNATNAAKSIPATSQNNAWRAWEKGLLAIWFFGMAMLLLRYLLGVLFVWRLGRKSKPVDSEEWLAALDETARGLAIRRRVLLLESPRCTIPMTWGIFRPVVLVPAEGKSWPAIRRRVVLAHELAHVKRRDCLAQLVAQLARAIYWFNPLAWLAWRRLLIESERACDDMVLAEGSKASDYAEHLLTVASGANASLFFSSAMQAMARPSQLQGRLLAILDEKRNRRELTRIAVAAAWLLLIGAVVPLSVLKAVADNPAPPAAVPPGETPKSAGAWGPASDGLACRIVTVAPQTDEQQPNIATAVLTNRFARAEDITLLAELKNVGDKPLTVQGTLYGDGVSPPWPGKSKSAEFAPLLFTYEFFDMAGKPLDGPVPSTKDMDAMLRLSGGSAESIAPGKSLVVLLRPADGDLGLARRLTSGKCQVRVRYHGPLPGVHKEMQRVWPKKPLTHVWSGDAASGMAPLSLVSTRQKTELAWGPAKNGLRAAVEFLPIDSIEVGGRNKVLVHLENAGKADISLWSENWRQDDSVYCIDAGSKETELHHAWYSGWPIMERWSLKPGQAAVIAAIDLGSAADENSAKKLEHPIGPVVIGPPGKYNLRYEIHLDRLKTKSPDGKTTIPGPGDWQGTLSTGNVTLTVRSRPTVGGPPSGPAAPIPGG